MRQDRSRAGASLSLAFVSLFMLASIHLALAENNSSTDYVRYVITDNQLGSLFDMQLGENSGSLTRGWVENCYYLLVTENRLAT